MSFDRKAVARDALDLVGDAPVPGKREWMTARRAAVLAVLTFAAAGVAVIGCVVLLYLQITGEEERSKQAAEQAAELAEKRVLAQLDQRSAARDASDAARDAQVRDAVCIVLPDLPSPSERVQALSMALGCPVAAAGEPAPQPATAGALPGPEASAVTPRQPLPEASPPAPAPQPGPAGAPAPGPPGSTAPQPPTPPGPAPENPDDQPPLSLPPLTCDLPLLGRPLCS